MGKNISILSKFSDKYSVDPNKMLETLKSVAFKQAFNKPPVTDEQMIALLVVADQYSLNPFTKEIYAFPDKGSIVPVVGVDGWFRLMNSNPNFDGIEFAFSESFVDTQGGKPCPEWCEATIYRKDRNHPIKVREYIDEVYRPPMNGKNGPWQTHTKRMLRHKSAVQAARVGLGFTGIYDEDEADRIIESSKNEIDVTPAKEVSEDDIVLTPYPDDRFINNLESWKAAISNGSQSIESLNNLIYSKDWYLTEDQMSKLGAKNENS